MTAPWARIPTLALSMLLAFATAARAESVDWSEYIDKNPSQPVATKPAKASDAQAKPAATRPAKTVASKTRPKARAKAKSRHR